VQDLTVFVLPNFEDDRVQSVTHPADRQILLRNIDSPIEPIRPGEQLLSFLEPDPTFGIRSEALALPDIEAEAHGVI
jgi:hypothetical protein